MSLTVPLVLDDKRQEPGYKIEDIESNNNLNCTSFLKTCFNGVNALSGVGILSVPYALASAGWLSLILLFAIAFATYYSGLLIQRCMDLDSGVTSYPDIGKRAFGEVGRIFISIVIYLELYLVATGFLILEGDNLHNLFPYMVIETVGFTISGKQLFVILIALVILPTVWLDNLSLLSYVSASGVLASAIILGSILWTGAFDGIGFQQKGVLLNWNGIPSAVSLFTFCYCAHPVLPTLYTSMKNKRHFSNVLRVCFTLCTITYVSMAVFGYLMFGSGIESQITLNLPRGKLSSKVAIYTTLVSPIAKYALMVTPIIDAAKSSCLQKKREYNTRLLGLVISTTLVISNVVVAITIPLFASLITLVGAFLSVTASIIMPCLCYLKITGKYRVFGCEMVSTGCIILMGLLILVFGTYTSLLEIIAHFQTNFKG